MKYSLNEASPTPDSQIRSNFDQSSKPLKVKIVKKPELVEQIPPMTQTQILKYVQILSAQ